LNEIQDIYAFIKDAVGRGDTVKTTKNKKITPKMK
jgi:hypothetical protein